MNKILLVAIATMLVAVASPATACLVGDIRPSAEVPTLIEACYPKNGGVAADGSPGGSWLVVTSCLSGKVAVVGSSGVPVYNGRFHGAVVSCVSAHEATDLALQRIDEALQEIFILQQKYLSAPSANTLQKK